MNIIKSNPELNNMFKRIRNRRRLAEALEENNIDVETTAEKEEAEGSGKTEFEEQLGGLGIDVQTVGVSQSIQDASEMMDVAGVGAGQTAGQVARDIAKENRSFADPFAEAITSLGGREGIAAKAGLATYGSLLAGQTELAKGLYTGTQMLAGPAGMALNVIGPTELDPYGKPVAMGSGAFAKASSKVMDIHYNVADKMAQGIAGYDQGYINNQLISVSPGFFGGKVLTGNVPVGMTVSDFTDLMEQAAAVEDEDAISGYAQGNPLAMMEAGITVSDYDSPTQAAQDKIGYSSYDPVTGQPTGAAPKGSQVSKTGVFGSVYTDYGDDNNNDTGTDDTSGGYGGADNTTDYGGTRYGGKIGMQMGGNPAQQQTPTGEMGFVGGPPDQFTEKQTIADDIPKTVPEGAFVINAPAVEFAGKEDIKQMLVKAYEIVAQADIDAGVDKSPRAAKIPSKEQVDIMISRGEVIVPPEIAKIIGYDRLEKINNRGKKEVARRQEESQKEEKPQAKSVAGGGFIDMQNGGKIDVRKNIADLLGVLDDAQEASRNSRIYTEIHKPKDDDKTEDMVRHILGSGYMADNIIGSFAFDFDEEANRPFGELYDKAYKIVTGKDRFVPEYDKTIRKESSIDLNNNEYGRLLRKKYPDKEKFTEQVFMLASSIAKGIPPSEFAIGDIQPQLSLGSKILNKAGADRDIAIREKLKRGAEEGAFDPFADYNKQGDLQN
jgi:hypothetical protein